MISPTDDGAKAFVENVFTGTVTKMSDVDAKFLQDMIVHHEAALAMSKKYLAADPSKRLPVVSTLAANIVSAQDDEIAKMRRWLKSAGRAEQQVGGPKPAMKM